ncbi:MAG: FtsX-like permease family protein [Gemmatimonadales bacterium]
MNSRGGAKGNGEREGKETATGAPFPFSLFPFPRFLRNLTRHPVRNGLALAGIAVTTAMLLNMVLLAGGIERSFEQLLLGRGYQIRISPKGTLPFDTEATIPGIERIRAAIAQDPSVASVAPLAGASLYGRRGDSLITLFGYGIDPAHQALYLLEQGADLQPGDTTGLLLSEPAARLLNAALGDTVTLVSRLDPQVIVAGSTRRLVARGVVRWLYDYKGQPSVGTALPVLQDLAGFRDEDRGSAIIVRVQADEEVEPTAARLRAAFPRLEVNSVADLLVHFRERLVYFRQLSFILGSISLIVTVLLVATLMTITVNERRGEIATLRAIGMSRIRVIQGVMLEGGALTLIGGALGALLGSVTAHYLDQILTSFPGLPAAISFFVPHTASLVVAGLVLVAAGVVAGVYPAWLAARAPIAATLRTEAT